MGIFRTKNRLAAKSPCLLKSESGIGLLQVIVAVGLTGIVSMGVLSIVSLLLKSQRQSNLIFQLDVLRRSLAATVTSPNSWEQIVQAPQNAGTSGAPGMECLATGSTIPCTANGVDKSAGGQPITDRPVAQILDPNGTLIYDPSNPNNGFTAQGVRCSTFVAPPLAGNDNCPIRYNVTWTAICSATTCVNPQVSLRFTLQYNPGTAEARTQLNPDNYSMSLIQNQIGNGGCWIVNTNTMYEVCANRVGIGTATPARILTIHGNAAMGIMQITNNAAGGGAGDGLLLYHNGIDAHVSNQEAGILAFQTSNTDRMTITATGNVGIGLGNPQERLDVGTGNIKMGYRIIRTSCAANNQCWATCPAGLYVIGGGCDSGNMNKYMNRSYPSSPTTWYCYTSSPDFIAAYAICAQIR